MSALTIDRDTPERKAKNRRFTASAEIFTGSLVALNTATGKVCPAADAENMVVVGRAEYHAEANETVHVSVGCFAFENAGNVTSAHIGSNVYIADDQTVSAAAGTKSVVAGKVFDLDEAGVWIRID